jgi:hypothetical protein
MKKWFCLLVLLFPAVVFAEAVSGTPADHDQLRHLLEMAQEAINNDNPDQLEAYLHKDYVITVMNQELVTKDRTLKELFNDWFKKPDAILKSLTVKPEATIETRIYDDRFGVCYGTSVDTYTLQDGREFSFDSKWTATVIKQDGQWKLLALHVGVDPIENPLIDGYRSGMGFGGVMIEFGRLLFD